MPEVQLSDGRAVSFPDGMSMDDMASALKKLPAYRPGDAPKRTGYLANIGAAAADTVANTAGLPVDLLTGAVNLLSRGVNSATGTNIPPIRDPIGGSNSIKSLYGLAGADPRETAPATRGEALARAFGTGALGAMLPGAAARALPMAGGALGAVQGAVASGAGPGAGAIGGAAASAGNLAEQAVPPAWAPAANVAAQLATGAGVGLAGQAARKAGDAFMGVGNITPERASLAAKAVAPVDRGGYGLPLTAPDLQPGANPMRWLQTGLEYLPFSGATVRQGNLQAAVNQAVNRTMGQTGNTVTGENIRGARATAGGLYDRALTGATTSIDDPFIGSLADTASNLRLSGLSTNEQQAVGGVIRRILDAAQKNGGAIPGDVYQELRKRGSVLQNLMAPDRPTRPYAVEVQKALDDAFARSNPDRAEIFSRANSQWRATEAIRSEVKRGDPGNISPSRIQGAANRAYPERDILDRPNALGDLGDISQAFLRRLPESGTAPRSAFLSAAGKLASGSVGPAIGAAAGYGVGGAGLLPMMLGIPAVSGLGRAASSALNSQWMRDALLNRVLHPQPAGPTIPPWLAPAQIPALNREAP